MKTIGILGGSFNPAHEAHLAVSLMLMKRLRLDAVWWMVSPQNPLKSTQGMAKFEKRFKSAKQMAQHPRILVSDFEQRHHTRFTADTLRRLKRRHNKTRFVWLMGADNLIQIHRWQDWERIFHDVPVAVYDRPGYTQKALASKAAKRFRKNRCDPSQLMSHAHHLPAWTFLFGRRHALSSTYLRNLLGDRAFMRHNKTMG